jgi:hypothetical protein
LPEPVGVDSDFKNQFEIESPAEVILPRLSLLLLTTYGFIGSVSDFQGGTGITEPLQK